jgi:O-antigen/teichoic acid export membrane protein
MGLVHPDGAGSRLRDDDAHVERTIDRVERASTPDANRASLPRDTLWFASGTIAGKAAALVSLPVLARALTPAEFGQLDVLNALISAGLAVLVLGTDLAATRLYFDLRSSRDRRKLFSSWLTIVSVAAMTAFAVFGLAAAPISQALFETPDLASAVALVGVVLLVGLLHVVALGILRTTGRARSYGLLEGGALIANAALAVILLVVWRQDVTAVLLALAISWAVAAAIGLVVVRRSINASPSTADTKQLLRLGLPLAPAVGAIFLGDFLNRSFLLGIAGAEQAGYLSIALRIASIGGLVVAATQLAWQPHAFRLGTSRVAQLSREAHQIVVASALVVVVLCASIPATIAIVGGNAYLPAGPAAAVSLAGVLLAAMYLVASLPSAMSKATSDLAWSASIGVAGAVGANLILAPRLGAVGTATAMASGQAIAVAVIWRLSRRRFRLRLVTPGLVAILAAAFGMCIAMAVLWELPTLVGVVVVAGVVAIAWLDGTIPAVIRRSDEGP